MPILSTLYDNRSESHNNIACARVDEGNLFESLSGILIYSTLKLGAGIYEVGGKVMLRLRHSDPSNIRYRPARLERLL